MVTVVPPKLTTTEGEKSEPGGEERVFLCYFEKHGIMDGSILTISLKAALIGGQNFSCIAAMTSELLLHCPFPEAGQGLAGLADISKIIDTCI